MMSRTVRIGGASGFWGDSSEGAVQLVKSGEVDYVVMDYLAELTLSIMARSRHGKSSLGYATDFVSEVMPSILKEVTENKVRVIANAGGMNPRACADALRAIAENSGVKLRIGIVEGDDVLDLAPELRARKVSDMFEGLPIPKTLTSLNCYLGAFPIARALDLGAQVVITGRCVDSALALAPLIHEFGWERKDYDLLAAGSMVGHIIECGTQATGGLFTDWRQVPGRDDLGYPIATCFNDGTFELHKPINTGGLVTPLVAAEQMLYEVHDPENYMLPDVICDISSAQVEQIGENRVRFSNIRGRAPDCAYKTSATFDDGFRSSATLTIIGSDAVDKAEMTGEAILSRTRRLFRSRSIADYRETCVEVLGSGRSSFGPRASSLDAKEVVLRVAVRHDDERAMQIFSREIAPFGTAGVPGTTGFSGRPKAQRVFRLLSVLVPKELVVINVEVDGMSETMTSFHEAGMVSNVLKTPEPVGRRLSFHEEMIEVPLRSLAVARSGDKGDISNIAVICRHPDFYDLLITSLTAESVREFFAHLIKGDVKRYLVPGMHAFNFLLAGALAGGGSGSLRNDALGKGFAQILLDMQILVPTGWHDRLGPSQEHGSGSELERVSF